MYISDLLISNKKTYSKYSRVATQNTIKMGCHTIQGGGREKEVIFSPQEKVPLNIRHGLNQV